MDMDFVIDERAFRAVRLNARQQGHLSRRLAPLLPPLAPLIQRAVEEQSQKAGKSSDGLGILALAQPFADALASMSEADFDYVLDKTLSSVRVETAPNTWMPLWFEASSTTCVADLNDLSKLLPIVIKVVTLNLANFISGFLTSHEAPTQTSSGESSLAARVG